MDKPESTVTRWGWSKLRLWQECQTKYWNSELRTHPKATTQMGVEPRTISPALVIGGAVHKGLEVWYLGGWKDGADTGARDLGPAIQAAVAHLAHNAHRFRGGQDAYENAEVLVRGMLQGYHLKYEKDSLRVAPAPDGSPLVEREFHLSLGGGHLFTSRLDLVVFDPLEDPEGLWSLEHKTCAISKQNEAVEGWYVDGQVSGEQLQMQSHWGQERVRGVRINMLVKPEARRVPTNPFQRHDYARPQWQLEKFHLDARRRLSAIQEATEYYNLLTRHMTEEEAARVVFDAAQVGQGTCRGCDFLALCKNRAQSNFTLEANYQPKEER